MIKRLKLQRKYIKLIGLGVLVFALSLTLILVRTIQDHRSSAALPDQLETETGVLSSSGVTKQSDSGASGGQFIRFSRSGTGPTPTTSPNRPTLELNELKAFPTAYGGGATTKGGRGGIVVLVNTLDYDAPLTYVPANGSREAYYTGGIEPALENTSIGPRYVIFDVSGTIDANLPVTYSRYDTQNHVNRWGDGIFRNKPEESGFITVLGQTAPEGGVTLYRSWIFFFEQQEFIFRHMRTRTYLLRGSGDPIDDDQTTTPFHIGSTKVILDHLSASHGGDKGLIIGSYTPDYPNLNLTSQWNMVLQSATQIYSATGADSGPGHHDTMDNISFFYNLSMSRQRTPNMGGGESQTNYEVQNNVFQSGSNRFAAISRGTFNVNILNNYYDAIDNNILQNWVYDSAQPLFYSSGNHYIYDKGVLLYGNPGEDSSMIFGRFTTSEPLPSSYFTSKNMYGEIPNPAPLYSALEAKDKVLAKAGANRFIRDDGTRVFYKDSFDQEAVTRFNNRQEYTNDWSGFKLPIIPQNKRTSNYYQTVIGIPEWFVQKHGITDKDQVIKDWDFGDYKVINNAGYPAIEMYAAWVAHDFEELLGLP